MAEPVRVRIAPSPTGTLHIGNVRAGLFNWLFARRHGGVFILRIDDTDAARSKPEYEENIKASFRWLGMDWDEGPDVGGPYAPYRQSERMDRYRGAAEKLLAEGKAFRCFCSADELEAKRQQAARLKQAPRYDGRCLNLTDAERAAFEREGRKAAIRFRLADGPSVVVEDLIRGRVEFPRAMLDHFIIVRSDGKPVYNFCTSIDEMDHRITHVIRGDDHLSNTPKQMLIMEALGITPPKYAHLPQILGIDKARLSKRHGAQGVLELRDEGFLPEAVLNFLALLGWSYDDKTELFTPEELKASFGLDRVGKAPAVFDETKLLWMNGHYIRTSPAARIEADLRGRIAAAHGACPAAGDSAYVGRVIALLKDSLKTLGEIGPLSAFFFQEEVVWEDEAKKRLAGWPRAAEIMAAVAGMVKATEPFTPEALEAAFRAKANEMGLKFKDVVHPARFATTGRIAGPSLFHTLEVLGRDRCLERMEAAATLPK
jgi:glutamyl-tRNA synthetase